MVFLTRSHWVPVALILALGAAAVLLLACGDNDDAEPGSNPTSAGATATTAKLSGSLTVYSGRAESLVQPLIDEFEKATGVDVKVKYGDTAQLAALLLEEGKKSPADVYFAQDAGALGAVAAAGLLEKLPEVALVQVAPEYRAQNGQWVGVSGRARVVVYNPKIVSPSQLPASIKDLTRAEWKGQVGWAPTNGSFQAAVTAMRKVEGDKAAKAWLEAMKANGVKEYKDNSAIVSAVAAGEIAVGLVNHYYLYGFIKDQGEGFNARNHYTNADDAGSLVNVAGAAVLRTSSNMAAALAFVEFLLSDTAQQYFAQKTFEYPLAQRVAADDRLKPLKEIDPPDVDLSSLQDLQGTLALLREAKVLP